MEAPADEPGREHVLLARHEMEDEMARHVALQARGARDSQIILLPNEIGSLHRTNSRASRVRETKSRASMMIETNSRVFRVRGTNYRGSRVRKTGSKVSRAIETNSRASRVIFRMRETNYRTLG